MAAKLDSPSVGDEKLLKKSMPLETAGIVINGFCYHPEKYRIQLSVEERRNYMAVLEGKIEKPVEVDVRFVPDSVLRDPYFFFTWMIEKEGRYG